MTLDNIKVILSLAEDDTQDEIFLDNISLNKGDITFLKRKSTYDITVDSSVNEIKITAEPEDTSDRVRINGVSYGVYSSLEEAKSVAELNRPKHFKFL